MNYPYSIGIDMHRRYSLVSIKNTDTGQRTRIRLTHELSELRTMLKPYQGRAAAAVEATGNWYWLVDELESLEIKPHLAHPIATKPLINRLHKTDRIDADGLSDILAKDLLPQSWIATKAVRDGRELLRSRMNLVAAQTQTKNRIHALIARYCPGSPSCSDLFGSRGRAWLSRLQLPAHAQFALIQSLHLLDDIRPLIAASESRIRKLVETTPQIRILKTLPGVGNILSTVISYELGEVSRFATHERFCSYSGLSPVVNASGGKVRFGHTPKASNRYLRWAFIEAANIIAVHPSDKAPFRLLAALKSKHGYAIAAVALARHLAVAAFHMLRKGEAYDEARWALKWQKSCEKRNP